MVAELYTKLKELKVNVRLVNDKLDLQAPKGVLNEALLNEIKTHKEDLIQFISSYRQQKDGYQSIRKTGLQESYALSASQKMLWVVSQQEEGNIAYNMSGVYVFEGDLRQEALEFAFDRLIERHENLRTVFREDASEEIRQFILPAERIGFTLEYTDLRQLEHRDKKAKQLVQAAALRPFNLATGPLLRAGLYQVADNKWIFGHVMHHIISDGWSMGILIRELLELYNAHMQGKPDPLTPLHIQYKDYAAWHREALSGEMLAAHEAYWLDHFAGELPVLELPGDRIRPALKTYNGHLVNRVMDAGISADVLTLCREQGATLFMGLLAAVNVLLYRYTGQEDIIIGTPNAGRSHADLQDQIGFYVNTLALRTQFSGADDFRSVLANVRKVVLGADEHQVYPFGSLVEALQLQRDISRNPLFDIQVLVGHDDNSQLKERQTLAGLAVGEYEETTHDTARFDMVFNFKEIAGTIHLNLQYNVDIYTEQQIRQLIAHLEQLLAAIVSQPSLPVQQLSYLSAAERQQLLADFNHGVTIAGPVSEQTVVDLLDQQAALHPDHTAVSFEGTQLTYRALQEKANQLAHYLITEHQVKPNEMVGIMLDRSEKMLIGIWGILKAGAAYVPIDPDYPAARKAYVIKDTGIRMLLTQTEYFFDLDYYEGESFAVDVQLDTLETPVTAPSVTIAPDHLAYVIYTSGSTGNPKGVLITHGNLMHSLSSRPAIYDAYTSFLLLSSIAFDSSVAGIFGTLCYGGCLCITRKIDVANVDLIAGYLVDHAVSHLLTVPSYYKLLLNALANRNNHLRAVIVAGEACPAQLVTDHFNAPALQDCRFFNEYGPTEATVWSSVYVFERDAPIVPSIGKPIPGTRIYILDSEQQPVPAGVTGEIYIAGNGLARGYLHQPELTAEKFVTDPFQPTERMYRTGDSARWKADGNIIFIGRKDDQVKIRGYRIELGEIENALQGHAGVELATVVVRTDAAGNKELAAYVVGNTTLQAADLQTYLTGLLPSYALPAHYVQLEQFPLTPNGKVDRKKLPDPKGTGMSTGVPYVAPRNDAEARLLMIWKEILGKEKIGVNDSFFSLGGDSIKILRLMTEIRKKMSLEIPIADIYKNNTVALLAAHSYDNIIAIERRNNYLKETEVAVKAEILALKERILALDLLPEKENIADIFPMSDVEKGMVFESLINRERSIYHDQSLHPRIFADFDIARFRRALQLLVDKHAILRTSFNVTDFDTQVQLVHHRINVEIPYKDLSDLPHETQNNIIRTFVDGELHHPFDVSVAPLWRMSAFNVGNNKIVFVWQCHHAIIDGWSDALFMTELNNLYLTLGEDPAYLPEPLKADYRDFIIQHEVDKKDSQMNSFWQQELAEAKRLDLFTQAPDDSGYLHVLDKKHSDKLEDLAEDLDTTVKVISFSAYLYLLKILSYDEEVIAGLVTNTRPDCEDSDRILGCFLNTIPFKMVVDAPVKIADFILQVHEKIIGLKGNERLSLPEIARIHHQQTEAGNPFFDTFFNYVDFHEFQSIREEKAPVQPDTPAPSLNLKGTGRTNTYMDFTVNNTGGYLQVKFNLLRKLKSGLTAQQVGAIYLEILHAMSIDAEQIINQRDYLSAAAKEELLTAFNPAPVDFPATQTLTRLLEAQVALAPQQAALVFDTKEWTYQELNAIANQLGAYLRKHHGITAGELVGIQLERSDWMIIAILGVLKSGGAYVPVDPTYPAERRSYILEDSQCRVVIDAALLEQFRQEADHYAQENLEAVNNATDLAYIIYTSGSTGKPKGVMTEHRSVVNLITSQIRTFGITSSENILQFSSIAFDASVEQIFLAFSTGARLTVMDADTRLDPEKIAAFLTRHEITHLHTVPGVLKTIPVKQYPALKRVIAGGDSCPQDVAAQWSGEYDFYNEYGPTETTITATELHYQPGAVGPVLSIGRPVANTFVYITDHALNLVPAGVTGEICIGGSGVARGYLYRPELTAEKFVPNPFRPGERMYRTGDLGRWLPDGNILFTGRRDDQVKIRGNRVETGEVAAAIQTHPAVASAVVAARPDQQGEQQLTAYIVARESLNSSTLRAYLTDRLPAYMLPSHFVQLSALPLTATGKINFRALPEPEAAGLSAGVEYIAPQGIREVLLVAAFEAVLQKQAVGVNGDFFVLGGDSIKSIQVVSYLKQRGYALTIQDILLHPVITDLAKYIVPVTRVADQGPVTGIIPLSPVQTSFFLGDQTCIHHFNQSVLLNSREPIAAASLRAALDKLVQHHDALRMVYYNSPAGWVQENKGLEQSYALEVITPADEAAFGQHCDRLQAGINLETGPLFSVGLFRGESSDRLLLVIHHLVVDGVSWRILLEDLSNLYYQYQIGAALRLPQKTDAFKYWQEKQLAYAASETLAQEIPYWSAIAAADASLPVDMPEGSNRVADVAVTTFVLDEAQTTRLQTQCYRAYRTEVNDVLIGALSLALADVFKQPEVLIRLEGHGREQIGADVDVSRTVGWFTSMYPVLLDLQQAADPIAQLIAVKESLHRVPGKGIGYGILHYLAGKVPAVTPAVTFNYLGDFGGSVAASDQTPLFEFSGDYHGHEYPDNRQRTTLLDISGMVVSGQLRLSVGYSREQFTAATAGKLATAWQFRLEQLITQLSAATESRLTPVDLTYKGLSAAAVNALNENFDVEDVYPVTAMQRVLIHAYDAAATDAGVYHAISSWGFEDARFSLAALETSIQQLQEKHRVLRTVFFRPDNGDICQCVKTTVGDTVTVDDLTALSPQEQQAYILTAREADIRSKFRITDTPSLLFRFRIFILGAHAFELMFTCHHAIMDGWGFTILKNELLAGYLAARNGETVPVVIPADSFREYVQLGEAGAANEKNNQFWREALQNWQPLPLQPLTTAEQGTDSCSVHLDRALVQQLKAVAENNKVSLRSVFLKTGTEVLRQHWGVKELFLGLLFNGRTHELQDALNAVGLYWNILPFRAPEVDSYEAIQQQLNRYEAYAQFSAWKIREWVGQEPHQVSFSYSQFHNARNWQAETPAVQDQLPVMTGDFYMDRYHYPLNIKVMVKETDGTDIVIIMDYDRQYFSGEEIAQLLSQFVHQLK
ncbi:non-ribosomal peptide synthetase [Chitinophaga nivalis]|uniref:Amino acid adenylation domain-containing protein n=1 Tax=Chitinophaga nivalis TaxID=2991709 RepID=A0ABT3IJ31_9BACT|nr:non-ribosomal peptide synthetase [Chitinophaga nivalis]MCW3466338.1 amino acid adenylation domain-containing protein [Chitinophaga nivalis]MCW3483971.1 amino acid adenylation domain-containing protein [Chitinophaga nivalis]